MKECAIDRERTVVSHDQASEVSQPSVGALHYPSPSVTPQGSTVLRRRPNAVLFVRADELDPATLQTLSQRIAVVRFVGDHPHRLLPRTARMMTPSYADGRERRFREFDFRRGCRVKVVSQRKTAAVDHHHPLCPLAPLGFSDSAAPFFAGAKLPSRNDSLHFNCWRSFNSLRNARQMFNQTPRSSQSRSRRQHVEGCGNFSGRSCQRAPLRKIHRIPSSTRRFSIHGRPPLRCLGGLGSKGAIFFHCASVSNGPDRAIGPPSALLTLLISHFRLINHSHFNGLFKVVQQLLGETTSRTSTPPAANTFDTPAVNPPAPETEESLMDSDNSSGANKLHDATPSEEKSKESTRDSESFAKVPSADSNSSPTMESKPSANPEASPERKGSTGLIAPPPVNSQPAHSRKAVGPISGAPGNPTPRRVTPATRAAPHLSSPSTVLVAGPGDGSKPFRLILLEKPIAASSSFAMTSQLSVLVAPEPGPAPAHQPARLQAGELVSFVWPRYPRPGDRHRSSETVKVRTTIGELGQVLDVKHVSGSTSLLPAAMSAIRLWRYQPTLLNRRPVQAQQDVTIEFRPPQHLPRVPTRHPSDSRR